MVEVGRALGDADREERQQRGHEVGAGMQGFGDEAEASGDEAGGKLERDERRSREDREQRGPLLGTHQEATTSAAAASAATCSAWPRQRCTSRRSGPLAAWVTTRLHHCSGFARVDRRVREAEPERGGRREGSPPGRGARSRSSGVRRYHRIPGSLAIVLEGRRSADLPLAASDVYAVVADVRAYPAWQSIVDRVDVREADAQGRPLVVATALDAKVKVLRLVLRYTYDPPSRVSWTLQEGDVKDLRGSWQLEPRGDGACRVTYHVVVDPGRRLGLLLGGGAADRLRARVVEGPVEALRRKRGAGQPAWRPRAPTPPSPGAGRAGSPSPAAAP